MGWIPVLFRGELRHLEEVCAGPGIEKMARQEGLPGDLPDLAQRGRAGQQEVLQLFHEIGAILGQALAILVSTFNPEVIILGGGVSNCWDLMKDAAHPFLHRWSQPVAIQQVEVRVSQLGDNAGILGAAAAARWAAKR